MVNTGHVKALRKVYESKGKGLAFNLAKILGEGGIIPLCPHGSAGLGLGGIQQLRGQFAIF